MYIFLCRYPYLKKIPFWKRPFIKHKEPEILPSDEGRYNALIKYVLEWMESRSFFKLQITGENEFVCIPYPYDQHPGLKRSFHQIMTFNMRTLVNEEGWIALTGLLMDENNGRGTTDFIQLINTLISLFPEEMINTLISKLYRGVSSIVERQDRWEEWAQVHRNHPYVWIALLCNVLTYRFGDPRLI